MPTPVDAFAADATGLPPVGVCAGVGVLQGTIGVSPLFISLIACTLHTFEGVCVGVGVAVGVVVGEGVCVVVGVCVAVEVVVGVRV